jgi:hypothetical protein
MPANQNAATYSRGENDLQSDLFESEHLLGNFIGQSVVRHIDAEDLIALDAQVLSQDSIVSIARYLRFYEGLKSHDAQQRGETYVQSVHGARVTTLLARAGFSMQDILTPEPTRQYATGNEGGIAGGPEGLTCGYQLFSFGVGMTVLSGATTLWTGNVNPVDDAQVDVNLGFRHYFFPCQDGSENTSVRVSSNGYLTFFQQGGGAVLGTQYNNVAIAGPAAPDGFVAGWWDDLAVLNQGTVDVVSYKTEGAIGSREFTVQYFSVSRFGGLTVEHRNFQIKIRENHMQVQLHYGFPWLQDNGESATAGIPVASVSSPTPTGTSTTRRRQTPIAPRRFVWSRVRQSLAKTSARTEPTSPLVR